MASPVVKQEEVKETPSPLLKPEDYACFGFIDPNHAECKVCQFNKECADKKASK